MIFDCFCKCVVVVVALFWFFSQLVDCNLKPVRMSAKKKPYTKSVRETVKVSELLRKMKKEMFKKNIIY